MPEPNKKLPFTREDYFKMLDSKLKPQNPSRVGGFIDAFRARLGGNGNGHGKPFKLTPRKQ